MRKVNAIIKFETAKNIEGRKDNDTYSVDYIVSEEDKTIKKVFKHSKEYTDIFTKNGYINELIDYKLYSYNHDSGILETEKTVYIDGLSSIIKYTFDNTWEKHFIENYNQDSVLISTDEIIIEISNNIVFTNTIFHDIINDKKSNLRTITIYKDETLKEELYVINASSLGKDISKDTKITTDTNYKETIYGININTSVSDINEIHFSVRDSKKDKVFALNIQDSDKMMK